MAPEMAAHFRRAVHVHLIVDVQFSRTGVLPVMNRYQQRIVQINWICLKRSILQSPRSCKAIGCQARHAVSTGYRSINWKRQVSMSTTASPTNVTSLVAKRILSIRSHLSQGMYNAQSNAKHLLFHFETENTTPEFDIPNKLGTMMPWMTSVANKGAQT